VELSIKSKEELSRAARMLLDHARERRVFLFSGEMGAGKTTFIKVICEIMAVRSVTSSPTFSIINEYDSPQGPIFHFDFYRIKNGAEALDLGYEEYFYSGNYCFVEWPEKIANLLPENSVKVEINITGDNTRTFVFT
jgi:tRNA threonylcarbamoyladenosine biosynthesis protein TsaE